MRIAFKIEYDGSAYCGFQSQINGKTVQDEVERALNRVTGEGNKIFGAGRTDSGVHALNYPLHFDTNKNYPPAKFMQAVNAYLPSDIAVRDACVVDESFHARYSAIAKTYVYKCILDKYPRPHLRNTHMRIAAPINIDAMRQAAACLQGEHDFTSFCKADVAKSHIRTIYSITIIKSPDNEIIFTIRGNGFLYNMVRIIVAFLLNVGQGRLCANCVKDVLLSKSREYTRRLAEPQGLYLSEVEYETDPFSTQSVL